MRPVNPPGEHVIFGRIFADKIAHHAFDFLQKLLMARDEAGIGSAAEQDRALPDMPRPLNLDPWLSGLLPDRADDTCAPVVEGMIRSAREIEPAFRFLHGERIALLVKTMRRHRHRRRTAL